jgi:HK97 family phage portal protein
MILRSLRNRFGWYTPAEAVELYRKAGGDVQPEDQNFELYLRSIGVFHIVSACIDAIGKASATIPLKVMTADREEDDTHPLARLLANPNPEQGDFGFRYALAQQLGYTGEGYITTGEPGFTVPLEPPKHDIWIQRSDRMAPVLNRDLIRSGQEQNPIGHWEYGGAETVKLSTDQVIQIRWPHPYDPWRGLSPLKQLESILRVEFQLMGAASAYYQNGMRPSGVFKRATRPSDADIRRFKNEIANAYGGAENAGKVLFLWGEDLSFEQLADSMDKAASLEMMSALKKAVMSVFKVPPIVLGDPDGNTWATSREQKALFYENAVKPLVELILDTLNASGLVRAYGERVRVVADFSGVEALQPDQMAQAQRDAIYLQAKVRTINEIRDERDFGEPVEWGDEPPAPPSLLGGFGGFGAEEDEGDEPPAAPPTEEEEEGAKAFWTLVKASRRAKDLDNKRALRWKAFTERAAPYERAWARAIRSILRGVTEQSIERLRDMSQEATLSANGSQESKQDPTFSWTTEQIVDVAYHLKIAMDLLTPLAEATTRTGAEDIVSEAAGIFVPFDSSQPRVQEFITHRLATQVTTILQSQQKVVARAVQDAVTEGHTVDQLAKSLKQTFAKDSTSWAMRIARTETAGFYNAGGQAGLEDAGIETKQWLSSRDGDTRITHGTDPTQGADGQIVPVRENFKVGSAYGPYPGNLSEAGESINCRCTITSGDV